MLFCCCVTEFPETRVLLSKDRSRIFRRLIVIHENRATISYIGDQFIHHRILIVRLENGFIFKTFINSIVARRHSTGLQMSHGIFPLLKVWILNCYGRQSMHHMWKWVETWSCLKRVAWCMFSAITFHHSHSFFFPFVLVFFSSESKKQRTLQKKMKCFFSFFKYGPCFEPSSFFFEEK